MKSKLYCVIAIFLFFLNLKSQQKVYFIDKIDWEINIPEGFSDISAEKKPIQVVESGSAGQNKPAKSPGKVEKIVFKGKNRSQLLIQLEKTAIDETKYQQHIKNFEEAFYLQMKNALLYSEIKRSSSRKLIDGINFYKSIFEITISENITHHFITYNLLQDQYMIGFVMMSDRDDEIEKMMKVFENESKYKRKTKSN